MKPSLDKHLAISEIVRESLLLKQAILNDSRLIETVAEWEKR